MELWLMLLASLLSLVVTVINLITAVVTARNTQHEKKKELPPRKNKQKFHQTTERGNSSPIFYNHYMFFMCKNQVARSDCLVMGFDCYFSSCINHIDHRTEHDVKKQNITPDIRDRLPGGLSPPVSYCRFFVFLLLYFSFAVNGSLASS